MINNWFGHVVQFTGLVSYEKKVNEWFDLHAFGQIGSTTIMWYLV